MSHAALAGFAACMTKASMLKPTAYHVRNARLAQVTS